ncbi:ribonuclease III domain-containing protein [Bipolaris maydis]|nr:ribonuclease III domain-containing protein [Bipolaris maydis]KAJ6274746.1 ribonuclease III domain-containing protein [Bipolaris maydis]
MVSPNMMRYSSWPLLIRYAASKVTAIPFKSRYPFLCAYFQTTPQRSYNTPTINIDRKIAGVEKVFDYCFKNKIICAESVQMAAPEALLSIRGREYSIVHNRRLELVGDKIMGLVLSQRWYQVRNQNGHASPVKTWNDIHKSLISNEALAVRGFKLGLDAFVVPASGIHVTKNMMADAFEAMVGAVSLDAGEDAIEAVHDVLERTGFFNHPMLVR